MKARARAEKRGLVVRFFAGDNIMLEGKDGRIENVRAYIQGKYVYVRADHPLYTADQLMRHELGHDMIAKGEVKVNKVTQRLTKLVGEENVETVIEYYAAAYGNTGLTTEEIWEEIVCDSLGDMNIFAEDKVISEFMSPMIKDIKKSAYDTKGEANQTRGSPEGKASRELYTATNDFIRDVTYGDRRAFARSLANKTSGMVEGEVRTIYIYSTEKVYAFRADGYMHGEMIESLSPAEYNEKIKSRKEYKDELDSDRKTADLWAKPISDIGTESGSGVSLSEGGRRSASDDILSEDTSRSDRAGDHEREWENPRTEEEIHEIVNKVLVMYGLEPVDYSKQAKFSRELDTEYLSAVNRGDMETAQRMVDEVAKKAGYTVKAYHGTNADFFTFDKSRVGKGNDQYGAGFYFATDREAANHYGSRVISSALKIEKPFTISSTNLLDAEITFTDSQAYNIVKRHPMMYDTEESPLGDYYDSYWENGAEEWMIEDLASQYTDLGYLDSDLFRKYPNELHEAVRAVTGYDGVVVNLRNGEKFYVAWFDNQMKSTEPITYDDNGEIIPLSERFNPQSKDIRYSRELDLIDYINEKAKVERANMTKAQLVAKARSELESMKVGTGEIMAVQKVADKLFEQYGGEASISEFRYAMYEATRLALMEEGFDAAYEVINEIAKEVAYNPKDLGGEAEVVSEIKREIRGTKLSVHEEDKTSGEFDSYGGYGQKSRIYTYLKDKTKEKRFIKELSH